MGSRWLSSPHLHLHIVVPRGHCSIHGVVLFRTSRTEETLWSALSEGDIGPYFISLLPLGGSGSLLLLTLTLTLTLTPIPRSQRSTRWSSRPARIAITSRVY